MMICCFFFWGSTIYQRSCGLEPKKGKFWKRGSDFVLFFFSNQSSPVHLHPGHVVLKSILNHALGSKSCKHTETYHTFRTTLLKTLRTMQGQFSAIILTQSLLLTLTEASASSLLAKGCSKLSRRSTFQLPRTLPYTTVQYATLHYAKLHYNYSYPPQQHTMTKYSSYWFPIFKASAPALCSIIGIPISIGVYTA